MSDRIRLSAQVSPESGGQRLDQVAAQLFPDFSRSRLQGWIKDGSLLVDGERKRTRDSVYGGEELTLDAEREVQGEWQPEAIELDILYEDSALLVINKPAGLVVHPAMVGWRRDGSEQPPRTPQRSQPEAQWLQQPTADDLTPDAVVLMDGWVWTRNEVRSLIAAKANCGMGCS